MNNLYLAVIALVTVLLGYGSYEYITRDKPNTVSEENAVPQAESLVDQSGQGAGNGENLAELEARLREEIEKDLKPKLETSLRADIESSLKKDLQGGLETASSTIGEYKTKLADAEQKLKEVLGEAELTKQSLSDANTALEAAQSQIETFAASESQAGSMFDNVVEQIVELASQNGTTGVSDQGVSAAGLFENLDIENLDVSALSDDDKLSLIGSFIQNAQAVVSEANTIEQERLAKQRAEFEAELAKSNAAVAEAEAQLATLQSANQKQIEELKQRHLREMETYVQTGQSYLQTAEKSKEEQDRLRKDMDSLRGTMDLELGKKEELIAELQSASRMLQLGADLAFGFGSVKPSSKGEEILLKVKDIIEDYPDYDISLEGHTDNVGIRSSRQEKFPSNWELSSARASSAARFLIDQGVDPSRLRVVGLGAHRPIDSNDTETGRANNRRLEIVFIPRKLRLETID